MNNMEIEHSKKTLVVVTGPTAGGKTSLAIQLGLDLNTEIVSADSRQFYKEIKIGTAAPTIEELSKVKHYLVGNLSINDSYNVYQYEKEALECLDQIFAHHDYAVLVGGSGLYIDAICNGIDDIPDTPPDIRTRLQEEFKEKGIEWLQEQVRKTDPKYFDKTDQNNPKRLLRALEVSEVSGKPFSSFHRSSPKQRPFNIIKIGVLWDRSVLIDRIHQRVDLMIQEGLLDEVKEMYPFKHQNALNTVGYKEIFDHLDGKCSFDEAVEKIKTNTRRYAKRQMTWFRKDEKIKWFSPNSYKEIITFVRSGS